MNTVNIADMDAYHLLGTQVVLMEFKITSSNPWFQCSKLLYNPIVWDNVQRITKFDGLVRRHIFWNHELLIILGRKCDLHQNW